MKSLNNVVVLLDQFTRDHATSVAYDSIGKHATVLTDIRELTSAHTDCEFVFFESAVPVVVTLASITEACSQFNITPIFIHTTTEMGNLFCDKATTIRADFSVIDWNLIYAAVNGDSAILEPYQTPKRIISEMSLESSKIPVECRDMFNRMYKSYIDLSIAYRDMVSQNSKLTETVGLYRSVGRRTSEALTEIKTLLEESERKNMEYAALVSQSYDVVCFGVYPDRPRILYIKSLSHLSGIDSLIMTLYSSLVHQYKMSCKVVKLVDHTNTNGIRYVPNVYTPITDTYNTRDILMNDFVLCLGAYRILFDELLVNRSGLSYMIVHDQRATPNMAIDPSLVALQVNEMAGDHAVLAEHENVLSDVDAAQFVWDFKETSKHTGTRSLKLVNHPAVVSLLNYLV